MKIYIFGLISLTTLFSGCGTLIHGTTQEIRITSSPSGADVMIDGMKYSSTPVEVDLSRKSHHTITVSLDGYENFQILIERKLSALGILGGPVGWLVDDATGGLYRLKPNTIDVQLLEYENVHITPEKPDAGNK